MTWRRRLTVAIGALAVLGAGLAGCSDDDGGAADEPGRPGRPVDGALVGGASLDPGEFAAICRYQHHQVGL